MAIAWRVAFAVFLIAVTIPPAVRILRRLGYSGWWAIVAPISPLNLIGIWVLAYVRWPAVDHPRGTSGSGSGHLDT
jgi:hypothetical protein